MFSALFTKGFPDDTVPKEGDLYKEILLCGCVFRLYYGYYEECDRENPSVEPMPLYPDFLKCPQYAEDGSPFVTKVQDACEYYIGKEGRDRECAECAYYVHGEDFLGTCSSPQKRKKASLEEE